jgi:CheY-like chemotaxis protein
VLEPGTPTTKRIEKTFNILVVDDNEDSRVMMAELLSMEGHTIFQAKDAATAFEAINEHSLDVVISDIGLPGLDGYHIARTLRSMPELNPLRLIALTGFGTPDDQRKALKAGFDAHFIKPFDIDKLIAVLYDEL